MQRTGAVRRHASLGSQSAALCHCCQGTTHPQAQTSGMPSIALWGRASVGVGRAPPPTTLPTLAARTRCNRCSCPPGPWLHTRWRPADGARPHAGRWPANAGAGMQGGGQHGCKAAALPLLPPPLASCQCKPVRRSRGVPAGLRHAREFCQRSAQLPSRRGRLNHNPSSAAAHLQLWLRGPCSCDHTQGCREQHASPG